MRYNINKNFTRYNIETAELWLNQMSSEGKALVSMGTFSHIFEDCQPGQYQYKLVFNDLSSVAPNNIGFEDFLTGCGIDIVQKYGDWYILRRENNGEDFVIYSTLDSEIDYLENKLNGNFVWIILSIVLFAINTYKCIRLLFSPHTELIPAIMLISVMVMMIYITHKSVLYYNSIKSRIKELKKAREIHE